MAAGGYITRPFSGLRGQRGDSISGVSNNRREEGKRRDGVNQDGFHKVQRGVNTAETGCRNEVEAAGRRVTKSGDIKMNRPRVP